MASSSFFPVLPRLSIFNFIPTRVSKHVASSECTSSKSMKRGLFNWRWCSMSGGRMLSKIDILISSGSDSRSMPVPRRASYRLRSSIHCSTFSFSSSSLHFPGVKMCLSNDDLFAPAAGPYIASVQLLPTFKSISLLSVSDDQKRFTFQQVLQHRVDLGQFVFQCFFREVPGLNSDRALANVIASLCSSAHVGASSISGKMEQMKDPSSIFHRKKLSLSFPVNVSGLTIPLLSIRVTFLPSSFFIASVIAVWLAINAWINGVTAVPPPLRS